MCTFRRGEGRPSDGKRRRIYLLTVDIYRTHLKKYEAVLCPQKEGQGKSARKLGFCAESSPVVSCMVATLAFVCKYTQIIFPSIDYFGKNAEQIILQVFLALWYCYLSFDENLLGFSVLRVDDVHSHCHC